MRMGLAVGGADGGVNGPSATSAAERIVVSGSASACSDSHDAARFMASRRVVSIGDPFGPDRSRAQIRAVVVRHLAEPAGGGDRLDELAAIDSVAGWDVRDEGESAMCVLHD